MHRLLSITLALLAIAGTLPAPGMAQDSVQLHDGATYWQGQTLTRSDGVPNGATVSVRATTHQYYREYTAGRDGTVRFDTGNYKPGTYSLRQNGNEIARFHIEVQAIKIATASVDRDTGQANFTVNTPRAESDLIVNSSSLSNTELEHVFQNYTTAERDVDDDSRDEVILRDVRRDRQLVGDFANYRGTHTLRFDVLDTDAAARAKVGVGWPSHQQVALLDDQITDHRGDTIPVRIALPQTNTAHLDIGSEHVNYVLNASVTDSDGDNRVTVYLHTTEMGQPGRTLTAESGQVGVLNETQLPGQIDTTEYPVSVVDGNGNNDDLATLELRPGESKQAAAYTYPKGETPGSLLAVRDGNQDSTVVENETIALEYEVSGVYSSLKDATASDLVDGVEGVQLEITGERAKNVNSRPSLDVSEGDLLVRPDEETVALVLDTSDVNAELGSEYNATLRFEGRELDPLTTTFTVEPVRASFERPLPPAQTMVRGQTNYENGSTVTLGIYARNGNVQQSRSVTVGEDGRVRAPIDLRALEGESIHVRIKSAGEWHELPVREGAQTTTTATTTTTTAQPTTTTTPQQTPTQTPTTRQTTTTTQTTPAASTAATTAASNATVQTTTAAPNPQNGLLSGMGGILSFGVVALGGSLVLANRIAD